MSAAAGLFTIPATIASGQSVSGAVTLGLAPLVGISMPTLWTTAWLGLLSSIDGVTYQPVTDEETGLAVLLPAAAGQFIRIRPERWLGINQVQIQSLSADALRDPVAQVAARTINLLARAGLTGG